MGGGQSGRLAGAGRAGAPGVAGVSERGWGGGL